MLRHDRPTAPDASGMIGMTDRSTSRLLPFSIACPRRRMIRRPTPRCSHRPSVLTAIGETPTPTARQTDSRSSYRRPTLSDVGNVIMRDRRLMGRAATPTADVQLMMPHRSDSRDVRVPDDEWEAANLIAPVGAVRISLTDRDPPRPAPIDGASHRRSLSLSGRRVFDRREDGHRVCNHAANSSLPLSDGRRSARQDQDGSVRSCCVDGVHGQRRRHQRCDTVTWCSASDNSVACLAGSVCGVSSASARSDQSSHGPWVIR